MIIIAGCDAGIQITVRGRAATCSSRGDAATKTSDLRWNKGKRLPNASMEKAEELLRFTGTQENIPNLESSYFLHP